MRAAIVQPNFLPWRGAFDLISRVDVFIFLDTVQYTKGDWRNRNRILMRDGTAQWLTVPVEKAGKVPICDVVIDNAQNWREKHLRSITHNYKNAPFFDDMTNMLGRAYNEKLERLVDLTIPLTIEVARFLGIQTKFVNASDLRSEDRGKNERLISLLTQVGATSYLSGPSAAGYLDAPVWRDAGIALEIIQYPEYPAYAQIAEGYHPNLSILDLICMQGGNARSYVWPNSDKGGKTV